MGAPTISRFPNPAWAEGARVSTADSAARSGLSRAGRITTPIETARASLAWIWNEYECVYTVTAMRGVEPCVLPAQLSFRRCRGQRLS